MKLLGEGGTPDSLVMYGELESSIPSLKMIPADRDMTFDPKSKFMELVAGGHSAPVLGDGRQVGRPVVVRD